MGKRDLWCTVGGIEIGAVTVENSMEISQKTKNETALSLRNLTSENLSKET